MQTTIVDAEGIGPFEADWRRLATDRGNAFITPEWFRCWSQHYGQDDLTLVTAVHRDDGDLAGTLPLAFPRRGRPAACRIAGANLGDRFHPACLPDDEVAVARASGAALSSAGPRWSVIALEKIAHERPWVDALAEGTGVRLHGFRRTVATLPNIDLGAYADWEAYLASRSANFRQQVRRFTRRARRDHALRFRRTESPDQVASDIAAFFELHDRRWESQSSLTSERARAFHTDFAEAALARGWLRLWFLELDGKAVASWYGWLIGGRYSYYNGGFDPAWSRLSPGLVLMAGVIEAAIAEGAATFDLLLGDESYKFRFADDGPTVEDVSLVRSFPHPAAVLVYGEQAARRAGRLIPPKTRRRLGLNRLARRSSVPGRER